MRSAICTIFAFLLLLSAPATSRAQAPSAALVVTVVDSTGAVLPGATVTVEGLDAGNKSPAVAPVQTSTDGVATIARLAPGRYSVEAAFSGFETKKLPDIRVRAGNNKQVILLPIEGVKQSVIVGQDQQAAASDRRGSSFGTTLTREQLDALSDDPDVLRQQLQDMAGPGAVISVDSFEGAALPPKAQIRSIRISRDQFAAEYHNAGGVSIEIITQPGLGPIRMNLGYRMRGDRLTGQSPFVPERGPEKFQTMFLGGGGTLVKNKSSFNVFFTGVDSFVTPNVNAALPGGTRSEAARVTSPRDNYGVNANVDYAATIDQTLRFGLNVFHNNDKNLGIGQYDQEGRGYARESTNGSFRAQQIGPLGRRGFLRTRLGVSWSDSDSRAAVELPTIHVNDAFTSGGAQVAGGQHSRTLVFGSDLDYVRGSHSWRTGLQIDAGRWRSDDASNYLGTYTFESLTAYEAGLPRSYTRRIGDPHVTYNNAQGGIYVQDDIRVRKNLTLSAGARYELQTHVRDWNNLMPRVGVTWSPFASGKTTLRSSWGIFNDWLPTGTYEQTLRVDGFHQQELDIANPPYPILTGIPIGSVPANRYLFGDVALTGSNRVSLGVDQRMFRALQVSATYAYVRGGSLARGLNLNAPVNGVRPDPQFGNVIQVVSDARARQHQLQVNATANPGALLPINNARTAPLVSFKRTTLFFNYTLASLRNNTDGAFAIPATGQLHLEWGPAIADIRNRMNVSLNNQIIKNLLVGLNLNVSGGAPYTIRTGRDDNGDLVYNDRPAAVGRNSKRAAMQWTLNANIGYGWTFGRAVGGPAGVGVIFNGTDATVRSIDQGQRFRLQFFVQANNLTNRYNYIGYSGTLTSPFYGQPTAVTGTRRIETGFNFGF